MDLVPLLGAWSSGEGPLYSRLASAIEGAIETGDVAAGTRLPPERALAEALELSRTTVVLAYGRLRELGLLESRQGSGTWVGRSATARKALRDERGRSFLVDTLTRAELAEFLENGTARARRLRQSTPFRGLLTKRERRRIERV